MTLFDRLDPDSLERRERQVWLLAMTTIFVLATGLALMMYTVLFSRPVALSGRTFTTFFAGYCVLILLLVGYLIERQLVIGRLRRRVREEERQIVNLQLEVRSNLLETLPGLAHFQDRLAMEHRRASRAEQPFSLVVVGVKPSPALGTPSKATLTTMFGETAKALIRRLRGDDSIYHFGRGVFGILLPRVHTSIANLIAENLRKDLREVIGADLGSFEMQIISFPDDAASAREEEGAVVNFLSDKEMDSALDGAVRTRNSLLRDRLRAAACNYPANSSRVLTL